jgi:P-type Cu+ transporter
VLVEADTSRITKGELAETVRKLGYDVSATEVQQFATDDALFQLIKRRGFIGMALSVLDLLVDPVSLFGVAPRPSALFSLVVAAFVLLWVGYPILRKTLLAIRQRVINANVLLSTGAWGSFAVGTLALFDPRWPKGRTSCRSQRGSWPALHLFFGYFKLDTRKKASEAVRKLLSLQPARARAARRRPRRRPHRRRDTRRGHAREAGRAHPARRRDRGRERSVDESSFTGESLPAARAPATR